MATDNFPQLSAIVLKPKRKLKTYTINNQIELVVTRDDLIEADARFVFNNIDKLRFEGNLDQDTLKKHVKVINNCDLVEFPKSVPKLFALSLLQHCKKYKF